MDNDDLYFNQITRQFSDFGIENHSYVNRLEVCLDQRTCIGKLARAIHPSKWDINETPASYSLAKQAHRKLEMDLIDPAVLDSMKDAIRGHYTIDHVGLKLALRVHGIDAFKRLSQFLNCHLVHESRTANGGPRFYYESDAHSTYFSGAGDQIRVALCGYDEGYFATRAETDDDDDEDGCMKAELRFSFSGQTALDSIGIRTINDLIGFDQEAFWSSHLDLRYLRWSPLGQWTPSIDMTGTKTGLQGLLSNHPHYVDAFTRITSEEVLSSRLMAYMA
jgi:hypothetical protein